MRSKLMLWVVASLATAAFAKDPKPYQTGKLVQMESVPCEIARRKTSDVAGEKCWAQTPEQRERTSFFAKDKQLQSRE